MKKALVIAVLTIWFYLCMCIIVNAQTAIYRSVQPGNVSAIATNASGTITLTISGSTATFSAPLPDTIGIGCVIQYDANNDETVDNLAFIHGRTSSTVFTVKDSLGAAPSPSVTGDDAWSIFHAYTTLANWESGTENTGITAALRNFDPGNRNINTANEQWFLCLYRGTETITTNLDINWTTGAVGTDKKINIFPPRTTSEVGISQFHNGSFSGGYRVVNTNGTIDLIYLSVLQIRIDGLIMHLNNISATAQACIAPFLSFETTEQIVENCIFKGKASGDGGNYALLGAGAGATVVLKARNNYIFEFNSGTGTGTGINWNNTCTLYAYNNTIYGCSDFGIVRSSGAVHIKNNICASNGVDFSGTFSTSEYNASSDATASGTGSRTTQTFSFVDAANGNLALTVSDAGAKDFGSDLSGDANLPVTDDIVETARPQGSAYDIGAFEVIISDGGRRRWIIQ